MFGGGGVFCWVGGLWMEIGELAFGDGGKRHYYILLTLLNRGI